MLQNQTEVRHWSVNISSFCLTHFPIMDFNDALKIYSEEILNNCIALSCLAGSLQCKLFGALFPPPSPSPRACSQASGVQWRACRAESHVFVRGKLTNHNVRYYKDVLACLYRLLWLVKIMYQTPFLSNRKFYPRSPVKRLSFEDGKIAVALLNLAEILIFLSFCR